MAVANSVEKRYTANMGIMQISGANGNLDGTGTVYTVITGASSGTLVKTIIIKAVSDTTPGMIRIFFKKSGGSAMLHSEIRVLPMTKSGRDVTFSRVLPLFVIVGT